MDKITLSLPTGETNVDWIIREYLSIMCSISVRLKGHIFLFYAIRLCYEQTSYLKQENEDKLLEELRDIVSSKRDDMKDLKISQIKRYITAAINRAWTRRLGIDEGPYPPCPLSFNDFLNRSLEALSMEGPYWKRRLVFWRVKQEFADSFRDNQSPRISINESNKNKNC